MKKAKLLVLSLLAVSAIGLTSCGQTGPKGDTGEQGEKGEKGDAGTPGKDGTDGVDGKSFLNGEGAPSDTLGNDGDSYVDTTTYDYYAKENGKWVLKGNIKGEKGDTGAKGDAGEKGGKGDAGSKGEKGDTGSKGNTGSKGDTAWSNTILPFDYGYITASSGSATIDETVTFKVTITDKSCVAFKVLFNGEEEEASEIHKTSETGNVFEISKEMPETNGYVVRAVGYKELPKAMMSARNFSLAKDVTYTSPITTEASLFNDGSLLSIYNDGDLMPFEGSGTTGELKISSSVNLNLNGYDINLGNNKIVVSDAEFNVVNTNKAEKHAEIKSNSETVIEVKGQAKAESTPTTSLSVGNNVDIFGTTAIKQSGATSSVSVNEGSKVTGTTSAIEVSGGSLTIDGGTVEATGSTSDDGKSGSAIVINNSDSSDEISVDIASGTVSSTNSYAIYQENAAETGQTVKITYDSTGEVTGSKGSANENAKKDIEVKSDEGFTYDEKSSTYTISSKEGLINFRKAVESIGAFEGKTVKLEADIDLSGETWTPIGTKNAFDGTFDGNGHTIKNATIAYGSTKDTNCGGGLFSYLDGATIKNLTLTGFNVHNADTSTDGAYSGNVYAVLSAYTNGKCTIDKVTVSNSVVSGYGKIAGLVGQNNGNLTIKDSTVTGSTINGAYNLAGLVGVVNSTLGDANSDCGSLTLSNNTVSNVTFTYSSYDEYFVGKEGIKEKQTINGLEGSYIGVKGQQDKQWHAYSSTYYNVLLADRDGLKGSEISVNKEIDVNVYDDLVEALKTSDNTDVHYGVKGGDSQGIYFDSTNTRPFSKVGTEVAVIKHWTDVWFAGNLTLEGFNFLNGATFTANAEIEDTAAATLNLNKCTFFACDQSKIALETRKTNTGAGMCLDLETLGKAVNFNVDSCQSVGENDNSLSREGNNYTDSADGTTIDSKNAKKRANGLSLNGISGSTNENTVLNYKNSTIAGVRGHAIHLYEAAANKKYDVTIENVEVFSWGVCKEVAEETKDASVIRGILKKDSSITVTKLKVNLDEKMKDNTTFVLRHFELDNWTHNTDGSKKAQTYNFEKETSTIA